MARATSSPAAPGSSGPHVVDALAARGDAVRVVDDLSTGCRDNLAAHPEVELIEADLAERQVAEAVVAGIDYAIHLAAIPSVRRSVREPRRTHRANVEATHELLLAAREAGVRRVVLASSSSVYGESESLPQHEGLPPAPLSPYALHKLIGEQYAALFNRRYGLETVALRFFNVFGPRQVPAVAGTRASSRSSRRRCSKAGRLRSTATASRRATSSASPTSPAASCSPALRRMPWAGPSTSRAADACR